MISQICIVLLGNFSCQPFVKIMSNIIQMCNQLDRSCLVGSCRAPCLLASIKEIGCFYVKILNLEGLVAERQCEDTTWKLRNLRLHRLTLAIRETAGVILQKLQR